MPDRSTGLASPKPPVRVEPATIEDLPDWWGSGWNFFKKHCFEFSHLIPMRRLIE